MNFDFADILLAVLEHRASDLHISAGAEPMIRVRGQLKALEGFPKLSQQETREIVYGILNDDQRSRFERDRQLDLAYSIPGAARFRVNVYQQRLAVRAAFRLIPTEIPALASLGLPPIVDELVKKPRGLVLVTGPTGSGKSTSLAAMIDVINASRHEHIMTVEDPIEFLHSHKNCLINQRELGSDALSFSASLKAALRQDPDVILVGEMRDLETISTALTAAETGPLVFATLHTQDAPQTIDRVIDVFPAEQQGQIRMMLSVSLQGILTQQLLPTADGAGRTVAVEALIPTPAVRNLIREARRTRSTRPCRRAAPTACRRWTLRWPSCAARARSRASWPWRAQAIRRSSAACSAAASPSRPTATATAPGRSSDERRRLGLPGR